MLPEDDLPAIALAVLERRLTYLSPFKLAGLVRCAARVDADDVPGVIVEAGVALGGSAAVLAAGCPDREFHGYDVFGMIPPPGDHDGEKVHRRYAKIASGESPGIRGDAYYGYRDDLLGDVVSALRSLGVEVGDRVQMHQGLLQDTFHPPHPIALAHIDTDWYEPVRIALERVYPRLAPGGYIVCDDYFFFEGARRATDEFLLGAPDLERVVDEQHLVLRRAQ